VRSSRKHRSTVHRRRAHPHPKKHFPVNRALAQLAAGQCKKFKFLQSPWPPLFYFLLTLGGLMPKLFTHDQKRKSGNSTLPQSQPRTLLTVRQCADKHPAFPQGSLRNLIFLAESRGSSQGRIEGNGLDAALVRVGRKVLIDEAKFFQWIDAQQGGK
jgi:hypothetical protein